MTDLLDRRIRTLMMHVADASPEAPGTDKIEARRAAHQRPLSDGATPSELLLERRPARAAGHVTERRLPPAQAPLRTRPRWAEAVVAAVVVLALVGGIALLVQSPAGEGPPVITQPPAPTTTIPTPTTTTPAATPPPIALISAPIYADVPSFTGTVHFYEHDPALGSVGWQATIEISYAGPLKYEARMITGGEPYLGAAGSSYLGDGTVVRIVNPDGTYGEVLGAVDNLRSLYYDSEWPSPPWDEICAESAVSLGSEQLLGRTTSHVACSTSSENYELWIDETAGLVLKMAGSLTIGDYHPTAAPDGGFAFTEVLFEPVTIFEPPPIPTGQTGEFPPFHMIRTGGQNAAEYWYRDADTLRKTRSDGSFTLVADGRLAGCEPYDGETYCYDIPLEDADDNFPANSRPYRQLPVSLVEETCTEASQEPIAGRPARHFLCDDVSFPFTGTWAAAPTPGANSELWYDTETDLLMKWMDSEGSTTGHSGAGLEVMLLEVNPAYPVGIFTYSPPGVREGELAPAWRGPLIGGGGFDMAAYRHTVDTLENGSVVVVLKWSLACGPYCLEGLDMMQQLYDEYGKTDWPSMTGGFNVEFVTLINDTEGDTAQTLERQSIDVPTVYCGEEPIPEEDLYPPSCSDNLWDNSIPSVFVVGPSGQVEALYEARPSEYEAELEALLRSISRNTP